MLAVTDNAVAVIRDLTGQQNLPDSAGVRIASDPTQGALTMSLATSPQEGDQVVDTAGARLFLDGEAARVLDDKSLDAAVDANGAVQFEVGEQPN